MLFGDAGTDQVLQLALQHRFQGEVSAQPVIGGSVVFVVVGADLFGAVTTAHLGASVAAFAFRGSRLLPLQQFGAQDLQGPFPVLQLGAFLGAEHADARGFVEKVHGCFHLVDVLTPSTA